MMQSEFTQRAGRISPHGLGLSVDVYSPELLYLVQSLRDAELRAGYLEIFKATISAMRYVRRQLPDIKLAYHGEGLWVTQPDFSRSCSGRQGVAEACAQTAALGSAWLNHECATKQMAGYAFGTYLPPLYTELSARVTAENLIFLQGQLDQLVRYHMDVPPLVLLEMPPLTYFACGSLGIPEFFRMVTDRAPCGLVLDIGHLWTVYRYTGVWRRQALESFVGRFLDDFPMQRVVEIHVAGLAAQDETRKDAKPGTLPYWIDAHGAPIPDVLFDLLAQVLAHPRLTALKGVALEVDTKPVAAIVTEFRRFHERFESTVRCAEQAEHIDLPPSKQSEAKKYCRPAGSPTPEEQATLHRQYEGYVELVTAPDRASTARELSLLGGSLDDLDRYRETYLPHELLHWGGELNDMFPKTSDLLGAAGIPLDRFVSFWFEMPRPEQDEYDFFLLKIDRFIEFVERDCPSACTTVREEAEDLRAAYHAANEPILSAKVSA